MVDNPVPSNGWTTANSRCWQPWGRAMSHCMREMRLVSTSIANFIWTNAAQRLIQQVEPVDVSTTHSLTFTVKPHFLGARHDFVLTVISAKSQCWPQLKYLVREPTRLGERHGADLISHSYLQFTSVNSPDPSHSLIAFSSNFSCVSSLTSFASIYLKRQFRLDQMSGSFQSPVPELTSSIPVPSSVLSAHPNSISTTLLSATVSLSVSPTLPLSSRPASTSPSTTTTSSKSNAAARHPLRLSVVTLLGLSISFLV
jgi:hypothetical protein